MKAESTDLYHVVHNPRGAFWKDGDPDMFDIIPKNGRIDSTLMLTLLANNIHPIRRRRIQERIGSYRSTNLGCDGKIGRIFDLIEE